MKYFFFFLLFFSLLAGCKPKVLTGTALQDKLKETISNFLDTTLQKGIQFKVQDVTYFPDAKKGTYICQFHVYMKSRGKDTTGIVAATITNDFKDVKRSQ
ncbi:MAG: hypothetical protein ABI267_04275 [Ginsengibacter sp.]